MLKYGVTHEEIKELDREYVIYCRKATPISFQICQVLNHSSNKRKSVASPALISTFLGPTVHRWSLEKHISPSCVLWFE